MLALPATAVDDRDLADRRPSTDPAGEPASHAHQMGVVQLLIAVLVQAPPPDPEAARVITQREVSVEDNSVYAVVAAGQQVPIPLAEAIGHRRTVDEPCTPTTRRRRSRPLEERPQGSALTSGPCHPGSAGRGHSRAPLARTGPDLFMTCHSACRYLLVNPIARRATDSERSLGIGIGLLCSRDLKH